MNNLTHWHILGAGSMGCLWAYYLNKAGHEVTLICKDTAQQQLLQKAQPLTLIKQGQHFQAGNLHIRPLEDNNSQAPIRHLLVCLKAHQTRTALQTLQMQLQPDATIVLLQNGMGNQALLLQLFPHSAAYAAISTEAACKRDTLSVEHTGTGSTQLGALGKTQDPQILQKLHCDLNIELHPAIEAALWQKLVINCCINPLTAIYRCKNGELAHNAAAQQQIKAIINECKNVARASGKEHYLDGIKQKVAAVIEKTALNTSSMLQDVLQQRPTEIDYINGYICQSGSQHHIDTPVNRQLLTQVQQGIHHA